MNKTFLILFLLLALTAPAFLLGRFIVITDFWQMSLPILITLSFWQSTSLLLSYLLIRQYLIIKTRQDEAVARLEGEQEFRKFQQEERRLQQKERLEKQNISFQDFENLLELYKRNDSVSFEAFTKLYDWYKQKNL